MIKFSVLYPNEPGKKFDWDYYLSKHMPMAHQLLDPLGLVRSEVDKGVGSAEAPATFVGAAHMYFNSMDDFQNAFGARGGDLMIDMPNYTDIQPQVQVSEVVK
jgi:uncharacterized protein (TIGR02118 family)